MPLQPEDVLEFRPDDKGRFDELVARKPDMVHVETMTDKAVYIGFYWDDGRYCQLWINADKKLRYSHEAGFASPRDSRSKPLVETPSRLDREATKAAVPKAIAQPPAQPSEPQS